MQNENLEIFYMGAKQFCFQDYKDSLVFIITVSLEIFFLSANLILKFRTCTVWTFGFVEEHPM